MKQFHLFFSLIIICPIFVSYGQSVTISGPDEVEVGLPHNFNFSVDLNLPDGAEDYQIDHWQVAATYHLGNGEIQGHINYDETPDYNDFSNSKNLSVPIQWGSDLPVEMVEVRAYASGQYLNEDGFPFRSFNTGALNHSTKNVKVLRICTPNIVYDNVEDCNKAIVEIRAEEYCHGNEFNWSLSDGDIEGGQGTSAILVTPPLSGNFTANVEVTRSSSNPLYSKEKEETILRTDPEAILEILSGGTSTPNYICKGIGLEFGIEDNENISEIEWNANNSTISTEVIMDGKRVVTITPNSSFNNGSSININALVHYEGGCSTTTQSRFFTVYEPETPPAPQGYVYMEPIPAGVSVCEAQGFEVIFVASNPYNNGRTSISQAVLPPHAANTPYPITVYYSNICSGQQTSTTFYTSPPAPCGGPIKPYSTDISVAPNPTKGKITVNMSQKANGNYTIYNSNGAAVQQGKVNKIIRDIEFKSGLKAGTYFLEIEAQDQKITKQIILER